MMKPKKKNDKRFRKREFAFVIPCLLVVFFIGLAICLMLLLPLSFPPPTRLETITTTTAADTTTTAATTTTTSAPPITTPPALMCPITEFIQTPTVTGPNMCIAFNSNDGGLYYFNFEDQFRRLEINDYPNTITEGPNLGGPLPFRAAYPRGCVFDPVTNEFFIAAQGGDDWGRISTSNVYTIIGGQEGGILGLTPDNRLFGLVDGNENRRFDLQEYNTVTGANIGATIPIELDIAVPHVKYNGVGMSWDPMTNAMYVAFRAGAGPVENSNAAYVGSFIARLDVNTGFAEATCIDSLPRSVISIAFDNNGRLWAATGVAFTEFDKKREEPVVGLSIYTSDGVGPMPDGVSVPLWDVICENVTTDTANTLPLPFEIGYEISGLGCNSDVVERTVSTYLPGNLGVDPFELFEDPGGGGGGGGGGKGKRLTEHASPIHMDIMDGGDAVFVLLNVTGIPIPKSVIDAFFAANNTNSSFFETNNTNSKRDIPSHPYWYAQNAVTPTPPPSVFVGTNLMTQYMSSVAYADDAEGFVYMHEVFENGIPLFLSQRAGVAVELGASLSSNCLNVLQDIPVVVRFDAEADRIVIAHIANSGQSLCLTVSNPLPDLMSWSGFEFSLGSVSAEAFSFGVWDQQYIACMDNSTGVGVEQTHGICFALERDRIINGGGTPRQVSLPKHSLIFTEGKAATAVVMHQPHNNGGPGPYQSAFSFGSIVYMSPGSLGLVSISNINYDTMEVTSMESTTIIDSWNNGSNGTCVGPRSCIPIIGGGVMDPLRWEPGVGYRYFPSFSEERLAVGITIDADGTSLPRILWGEFFLNANGTTSLIKEMYTVSNSPTQPTFAPSFAYTPGGILCITYYSSASADGLLYSLTYRYLGSPSGEWTRNSLNPDKTLGDIIGTIVEYTRSLTPRTHPLTYPDTATVFGGGGPIHAGISPNYRVYSASSVFIATEEVFAEKVFTRDECNVTSTCISFITIAHPEIPPHVDSAKKRRLLRGEK